MILLVIDWYASFPADVDLMSDWTMRVVLLGPKYSSFREWTAALIEDRDCSSSTGRKIGKVERGGTPVIPFLVVEVTLVPKVHDEFCSTKRDAVGMMCCCCLFPGLELSLLVCVFGGVTCASLWL